MGRTVSWAICSISMLTTIGGCVVVSQNSLTVDGGDPVDYQCGNGERIVARYYSLSDKSLGFVKVRLANGTEYTLPQVVSGSGARYSDDREMVWWTKGETAFVEMRDKDGAWKTAYYDCTEVREK